MGITRATSGPVRCPWCSRPVADGPDRPEVCPSCGVPLAWSDDTSAPPVPVSLPSLRARRSQRLRAVSAILGLTSLVMAIAAVAVAPALLRQHDDNRRARDNLLAVLKAAEQIRLDTGDFTLAQPTVLENRVSADLKVVDETTSSAGPSEVSMQIHGDAWYGAVRSASGPCLAAATIAGNPKIVMTVLAGNCTGDAARAALMPLRPGPDATISAGGTTTGGSPSRGGLS